MQKTQYSNISNRLITASILLPIVIGIILQASLLQLYIFAGIIWCATFYELLCIMRISFFWCFLSMLALICSLIGVVWVDFLPIFISHTCVFLLSVAMLAYYPATKKFVILPTVVVCGALVVFASSFHSIMSLIAQDRIYVLLTCVFVWLADSGAYVHGKLFGKIKLCENISPAKTWAGVFGACLWTLIFVIFWAKFQITYKVLIFWLLGIIVAIYGDLIESMVKRVYKVKDSGTILPGHGGLLDRLDSLLFFLPISLFGAKYLL